MSDVDTSLAQEPVVMLTDRQAIEGILYHVTSIRFSDAMNVAAAQHQWKPYFTLVDARVTSLETGEEILRANFLLVARTRVLALLPKAEVIALRGQELPRIPAPPAPPEEEPAFAAVTDETTNGEPHAHGDANPVGEESGEADMTSTDESTNPPDESANAADQGALSPAEA
jgi:hypothetical protein